jgi:ABC-type dipeptide/oligopeptide/nickel transport system permease component
MQYVTAARALGFGDFRIIFNHILPNIMAPVIVISAANFASAILVESGLSFLGLGTAAIQLGSIIITTVTLYLANVFSYGSRYGHYVIDIGFMMGNAARRLRCETIRSWVNILRMKWANVFYRYVIDGVFSFIFL